MEVDRVWAGEECTGDGGYWEEEFRNADGEEKLEVDYVGDLCGGHGHYSRECPTPKGKGKGKGEPRGKGTGKSNYFEHGKGKGGYYEFGKGKGKGGGKERGGRGFGGECWTCGQRATGPTPAPTRGKRRRKSGAWRVRGWMDVGGLWTITQVAADPDPPALLPPFGRRTPRSPHSVHHGFAGCRAANLPKLPGGGDEEQVRAPGRAGGRG